mmetsp:Transcript_18482/g.37763  ORF Transcript_18482/g.37763 Transcript_18482/m.37763 type:complete len:259 (-) Transcript_18482:1237-2013(-)
MPDADPPAAASLRKPVTRDLACLDVFLSARREKIKSCMTSSKVHFETILPSPESFSRACSFFESSRPCLLGLMTLTPPEFFVSTVAAATRSLTSSSTSATVATLLPASALFLALPSFSSIHSFRASLMAWRLSSLLRHQSTNLAQSWKPFRLLLVMYKRKSHLDVSWDFFSSSASKTFFSARAASFAECRISVLSSSSMSRSPRLSSSAMALRRLILIPSLLPSQSTPRAWISLVITSEETISKLSIIESKNSSSSSK